jgi:hypothetical protein
MHTLFVFLLPAQYTPIIGAHPAGKTILAWMLFVNI